MKPYKHIAITLENTTVTAVEIEQGKSTKILTFGDFQSKINFDDLESIENKKEIILSEFKNFLLSIKSEAENISFALNSHSVFLSTIPIDENLNESEFSSVVKWEFEKYFSTLNQSDFLISNHKLPNELKSQFSNYLLVGIKKSLIKLLEEISKSLKKNLNIIELDHFCAEHFLNCTNSSIKQQRVAVIGADEKSFDISILKNSQCEQFLIFSIDDTKCYDRIAKFLLDNRATQIFVYGRFADGIVSSPLSKLVSIPISFLNPFTSLKINDAKNFPTENSYKYVSAAGLALRLN